MLTKRAISFKLYFTEQLLRGTLMRKGRIELFELHQQLRFVTCQCRLNHQKQAMNRQAIHLIAVIDPRHCKVRALEWFNTDPKVRQVRLDTPGFMVTSIVGHGFYGVVLGSTLKRWGPV